MANPPPDVVLALAQLKSRLDALNAEPVTGANIELKLVEIRDVRRQMDELARKIMELARGERRH